MPKTLMIQMCKLNINKLIKSYVAFQYAYFMSFFSLTSGDLVALSPALLISLPYNAALAYVCFQSSLFQ